MIASSIDRNSDRFFQAATYCEAKINSIQDDLSVKAIHPLFGFPFGIAKALLGIAQVIAGLSFSVFFLLTSMFADDTKKIWQCYRISQGQIINGCGNFILGSLEALPFIGSRVALHLFKVKERVEAHLKVKVESLPQAVGVGCFLKNSPTGHHFHTLPPTTDCYGLQIKTEQNNLASPMCFKTLDELERAIQKEIIKVGSIHYPSKIDELSKNLSKIMIDYYSGKTKSSAGLGNFLPLGGYSGIQNGYAYEYAGSIEKLPVIDPKYPIRIKLFVQVTVVYF